MPECPLLILPQIGPSLPRKKQSNFPREHFRLPNRAEQAKLFQVKFESMLESFVDDSPDGASTENVLVLETVGKVEDFKAAVRKVPGLEWQAEVDIDELDSDDYFYERPNIGVRFLKTNTTLFDVQESKEIQQSLVDSNLLDSDGRLKEGIADSDIKDAIPNHHKQHEDLIVDTIINEKKKPLAGRMYLSLSNRQAMDQVKRLFDINQKGGESPQLTGVWKNLFSHLRNIRYWDVEDRIRETGIINYWEQEVELKKGTASTIPFEIELTFSEELSIRTLRERSITTLVLEEKGTVLAACSIPEIRFHALKVELPVDRIEKVLEKQYGALFKSGGVMFFRPSAQCSSKQLPDGTLDKVKEVSPPGGEPIIGLLDGMPFSNHALLNGFLKIDDPDNFLSDYEPTEFRHGTAMASLICHGELDNEDIPISRKIYVRPILKPDNFSNGTEQIPNNVFFEDLIERSLRRMFEGEGNEPPAAPTVKIINLSIADPNRLFHRIVGPTAKLLDWLSYKYGVLFCVSSGNIIDEIYLNQTKQPFIEMEDEDKVTSTISAINSAKRNRRLFSPSEAVNVITVGALHDDNSNGPPLKNRIDILPSRALPSPISVTGHGFRSAIKPEIWLPGGRQLYNQLDRGFFTPSDAPSPPGQRVATAPVSPGEINRTIYTRGSSNATALASRSAAFIYDALEELFDSRGEEIPETHIAPLLKTLLVHSASWGEAAEILTSSLKLSGQKKSKELSRFLGYGIHDIERSVECSMSRATAVGFGSLGKDDRHDFRFPLPASLSGERVWRRLTVTLGWISPIGPENRKYRRAHLMFVPTGLDKQIGGKRNGAQWQQVRNGTIQHEVFEGKAVVAFLQGDTLVIPVQCREDAGTLDSKVSYALAVSLEAKEDTNLPIYEEIKEGIEILIREQVSDRIR